MAKPKHLGLNATEPHFSYPHELADVAAVQACVHGRADEHQQRRAMRWIVERGCMTYDETFDPKSERASAFMQGRRFVGLKIVLFSKPETLAAARKITEA